MSPKRIKIQNERFQRLKVEKTKTDETWGEFLLSLLEDATGPSTVRLAVKWVCAECMAELDRQTFPLNEKVRCVLDVPACETCHGAPAIPEIAYTTKTRTTTHENQKYDADS